MEFPEWKVKYCLKRVGGEEGVRRLRELYESGVPVMRIMEEFGLGSPECIYALIDSRRRGPYKPRRMVTPELEAEVVRLRRMGLKLGEIAEKGDLSVGSVYRILRKHGLTSRKKGGAG